MRRMRTPFISVFLVSLLVSGCATLTAEDTQLISINSAPAGATCSAANADGAWEIASTPASIAVKRSFSPLTISCKKEGYVDAATALMPYTRGRAYGNLLLAGIPAVVDAHTGAGYEYRPDNAMLQLQPQSAP